MEALGTTLLGIILLIGIIFILAKKSKVIGFIFISISIFFLFILPEFTFSKYKNESEGIYSNKIEQKIVIDDGTFIFYDKNKIVKSGLVDYSNIDSYSFFFDGQYISNEKGVIKSMKDDGNVFYKK